MLLLRSILLTIICVLLVSGCIEDEVEVTLNADGSGTVIQKITLSERLLVALSDGNIGDNTPPVTIDQVRQRIGSAFDITDLRQTDLPDGGKIFEIKGVFERPERFFLSTYCQKDLKIRLSPIGSGNAAIFSDIGFSGDGLGSGMTMERLYGLVKGLYISRTVALPADVVRTNGQLGGDKRSVRWVMDLRDRAGLAKTKTLIEGANEGKGVAEFDSRGLAFSLPLQIEEAEKISVEKQTPKTAPSASPFEADVVWVSCNRKRTIEGNMEITEAKIGVALRWEEECNPVRCKSPTLHTVLDNQNQDLVINKSSSISQSVSSIEQRERKKELNLLIAAPSENARSLKNITGHVEVVAKVATQEIVLDHLQSLRGASSTGNETLDRLHFKVRSIQGQTMEIEIEGGNNAIVSLEPLNKDGLAVRRQGGSGWGNNYRYDFAQDVSEIQKCRLEVVVSEEIVKIPFAINELPLP